MSKLLSVKQVAARRVHDTGYVLWVFIAAIMVFVSYVSIVKHDGTLSSVLMYGSILFNCSLILALLGERIELKAWAKVYRPEDKTYN